jgi:hypothetical protein
MRLSGRQLRPKLPDHFCELLEGHRMDSGGSLTEEAAAYPDRATRQCRRGETVARSEGNKSAALTAARNAKTSRPERCHSFDSRI